MLHLPLQLYFGSFASTGTLDFQEYILHLNSSPRAIFFFTVHLVLFSHVRSKAWFPTFTASGVGGQDVPPCRMSPRTSCSAEGVGSNSILGGAERNILCDRGDLRYMQVSRVKYWGGGGPYPFPRHPLFLRL